MKKNVLKKFIVSSLSSIRKHLKLYRKHPEPELIHDIRVDIKKIRALASFLKKQYKGKPLPKLKALNSIFSKAGEVRDLEINIRLLEELSHDNPLLLNELKERKERSGILFRKNIPAYIKTVKEIKSALKIPSKKPEKEFVKKYFDKLIEKADAYLHHPERKKELHEFRITIKKMMYVYDALPANLQDQCSLNQKYIVQLQEKAGEWHDTYTSLTFLQSVKSTATVPSAALVKQEEILFRSLCSHRRTFKRNIRLVPKPTI